MHKRTKTALLLASFFLLALLLSPPYFIAAIISAISLLAYYEWLTLIRAKWYVRNYFFGMLFFLMAVLAFYSNQNLTVIINSTYLIFWLIISLDIILGSNLTQQLLRKIPVLVGLFVILFSWYLLLSFNASGSTIINDSQGLLFSKVSFEDNLNYYFILLFVLVSLTDTSAYICGKKFGSIPLAKKISPGKTLEGFLSSLLIPSVIIYFSLSYLFNMPILVVDLLFILLCCAYCTVGDLFISILKRNNNVKNSGELFRFDNLRDNSGDLSTAKLLPGHGGILDRIDSYFSVIPIFQLWLFL